MAWHQYAAAVLTIGLAASPAVAQEVSGPPGPRLLMERAEEIALARSAAPASVSGDARVWFFQNGRYVIADSGSVDVECYVSRSWPLSLEPHCFDAEGARTIMRMAMRGVELAHAGIANEEAARRLAIALADGEFQLPIRPAMSWMMSAKQDLYSDQGQRAGAWQPHIMIYIPFLTAEMAGTGSNRDPYSGLVVDPGKPMANLMVVVPRSVQPVAAQPPGGERRY
ncbi:MAG: hypothetical protein KF709_04995 [Gemmatimonadaceae bacterium]|nr:hypothetical protein [Gemmatimonadaceae bacterium]